MNDSFVIWLGFAALFVVLFVIVAVFFDAFDTQTPSAVTPVASAIR